jgi:hypothetical protein
VVGLKFTLGLWMDYHEYLHNVKWRLAKKNWFGLKMPHIQSFIHALKVSWIKKILDPLNQGPWKVLISDHLVHSI